MSEPTGFPEAPQPGHPIRNGLFLLVGFLFVLFGTTFLALYVDWLWFREVRFAHVFSTILTTKLVLGGAAALGCFGLIYFNLRAAAGYPKDHLYKLMDTPSQIMLREVFENYLGPLVLAVAGVIALMSGMKASVQWESLLLFQNGTPFGQSDPQLGKDIGFYVFGLPFIHFIQSWLMGVLMLASVMVAAVYFVLGGIAMTPIGPRLDPRACRHLGLLVGSIFVVMGWGFYLDVFDTLFTKNGVVTGATYADVYARIPAYKLLAAVSAVAGVVIALYGARGSWKVPAAAAGVVMVLAFLGINMLPGLLQKYRVVPNEIVAESLFIKRNIQATRHGFGLTDISAEEFPAADNLTVDQLAANHTTIENVRLWDHKPLLSTYRQLQQIRTYYDFVDVDNDRYRIDGDLRQVMLSPRELSYSNLPGGANWINEHLTYTHGYGVSVGPVNRISPEGLPEFYVQDIPPVSTSDALNVTRPEIYYGELGNDYVFVRTRAKEFDYPVGDQNKYATYEGAGGVPVRSAFRKLVFAYYFKTTKILFSGDIVPESRIMFHRDIMDRVGKVAPYLVWDRDPYMVIKGDGRLVWMLDGYTATDRLPYGEKLGRLGNYIRNSVKAVVDAYDGTISLYVSDPDDPIIQTYEKAFPGTYQPLSAMPDELKAHMRYPQDLFSVQAYMLQKYHMQDPQIFYNNEDLWEIPRKGEQAMDPYYTVMRLPDGDSEEFILLLPYTPARRDNMTAWLAARSDGADYGKLVVYLFPKQKLIYGPRQIEARIDQDAKISEQLTLWSQMGSSVIRGTLLVIPIEDSLLYIEPLYLSAERGSLPELRRVIVSYGNQIAMEPNLEAALAKIFGGTGRSREAAAAAAAAGAPPPAPLTIEQLASEAAEVFEAAQKAQQEGDWATYGERLKELESVLREMNR
ncbi:MAG: UPF0182 family protein [Leptospirillia bacterium]